MELNIKTESVEAFVAALRAVSKDGTVVVNVYPSGKEDALADAKLALSMSYGGGTGIYRALTEQ
ncbi:MAG: hypothetical protein J6D21_12040 [Clostridia bacterium]|nr:hypothetical protein [Clostridia bacterium]